MHPDVADEQAYFDTALEHRERSRAQLDRAPALTVDATTAAELRQRLGSVGLADPDEGVAFGRIDRNGDKLYIGKNAIWGDDSELLVVNWQAPAAKAFYTATPASPEGLDARRTYRCESNKVLDIDEMVFRGLAGAVREGGPVLDDALLESLRRNRSGELADIVATIQTHQYEVISRPVEQLLVVQGGPGTGKTVVGLHRASWLLYKLSDRLHSEDVLVVGPNPAFVRYIRAVLPKLGDEAVVQRAVSELGPRVRGGRTEPAIIRKLKGDRRMIELVVRGLRNRQRIGHDPVELTVDGRHVSLDASLISARAAQLERRPHNEAHDGLREFIVSEVQAYLGRRGVLEASTLESITRGTSAREIDNYLDRVWPKLTSQAFVLDLLSTRRRLQAAAEGLFDEHEVTLLSVPRDARVGSWQWAVDDVPLLDAADFLLNGPQRTYEYIVVDEAQDLSPMQLLSIARRSRNGWMTVLGDLAQATSPYALGSWNDVADHLYRPDVRADLAELRLGYRLPTEVHDVAMRLLRVIAPGLDTPDAMRPSGQDVIVEKAEEGGVPAAVVRTIRPLLGTGLIGIITGDELRDKVTAALDAEGLFWAPELQAAAAPIVVLSAERAKGLEFDNVVVAEPAGILRDHGDTGLRALFVAITRPTRQLAIVHAEPLPPVLELGDDAPAPGTAATEAADRSGEPTTGSIPTVLAGTGGWATDAEAAATASAGGPSGSTPGAAPPVPAATPLTPLAPRPAVTDAAGPPFGAPPTPEPVAAGSPSPGGDAGAGPGVGTLSPGSDPSAAGPPFGMPSSGADPAPGSPPAAGGHGSDEVSPALSPLGPSRLGEALRGRSGNELEQRVAGTVSAAIAQGVANALEQLVQPALLGEIVDELRRIVAERAADPSKAEGVSVRLPTEVVARADRAVAAGQADSVSGYIAAALDDKGKLAEVSGYVHQMLADAGGALPNDPDRR